MGGLAALVLVLSLVVRLLAPAPGTLIVVLSSHTATAVKNVPLAVHGPNGWTSLPSITAHIAAAPEQTEATEVDVAAGHYDEVRFGSATTPAAFEVASKRIEPVLLAVEGGSVAAGGVYAGDEALNLGLGEISGKYTALPAFTLLDQAGRQVSDADLRGAPIVLAAFHTSCRATCPLYTGLLLQLQQELGARVHLVEVTTDPADTPEVLSTYAHRVGARWEFLTGSSAALQAFWAPLQVEIATGDSHTSTLAIADSHGYLRLVYRGVPDASTLPGVLTGQLDPTGLAELGHGDGWGTPEVLASLKTVEDFFQPEQPGGGPAPAFTLTDLGGSQVSLEAFTGKPVVLSFWATYCPICTSELPELVQAAQRHRVPLLLIDVRDNPASARSFLNQLKLQPVVPEDAEGKVATQYGVEGLPATFFIDSAGKVTGSYLGPFDEQTLGGKLAELSGQ